MLEVSCYDLVKRIQALEDKRYRGKVVKIAIQATKQNSTKTDLYYLISNKIKIDGFREPMDAPTLPIKITQLIEAKALLCDEVVKTWAEQNEELSNYVNQILTEEIDWQDIEQAIEEESNSILENIIQKFESKFEPNLNFDLEDIRLMVCFHIAQQSEALSVEDMDDLDGLDDLDETIEQALQEKELSHGDETGGSPPEMASLVFQQLLQEIEKIPPEALDWDDLDAFFSAAAKVRKQKQLYILQQRLQRRNEVEQLLESVVFDVIEEIEFHEITLPTADMLSTLSNDDYNDISKKLLSLHEILKHHREVQNIVAKKMSEEKEKRQRLSEIEAQIDSIKSSLAVFIPIATENCEEFAQTGNESFVSNVHEPDESIPVTSALEEDITFQDALNNITIELPENIIDQSESNDLDQPLEEELLGEIVLTPKKMQEEENKIAFDETEVSGTNPINTQEIAKQEENLNLEKMEDLFWQLIQKQDFAVAYWLSLSLKTNYIDRSVDPLVVAALYGSGILTQQNQGLVHDLLDITHRTSTTDANEYQEILMLAVAIRCSLIAPESGMLAWIQTPSLLPFTHDLVQTIKNFASRVRGLREEDFLGAAGIGEQDMVIKDIVKDIQAWLEQSHSKKLAIKRCSDVWSELLGHQGKLQVLLNKAIMDDRSSIPDVRREISLWKEAHHVDAIVDAIDAKKSFKKRSLIMGKPREQLLRTIREAIMRIEHWCDLVEREQKRLETGRDWVVEQISELRKDFEAKAPDILNSLKEVVDGGEQGLTQATECLQMSIASCCRMLGMKNVNSDAFFSVDASNTTEDLFSELRQRLYYLYELDLNDQGEASLEQNKKIASIILANSNRNVQEAIIGWMDSKDFRFIDSLLRLIPEDAEIVTQVEARKAGCNALLLAEVTSTEQDIEQATVDGIISEERNDYFAIVEAHRESSNLNFAKAMSELRKVKDCLEADRNRRINELNGEWISLKLQIDNLQMGINLQKRIVDFVENSLKRRDTRTVQECFDRLTELIETGKEIDETSFSFLHEPDDVTLKDFLDQLGLITEELSTSGFSKLISAIRQERSWLGMNFSQIPKPLRDGALRGIESWRILKGDGVGGRNTNRLIRDIVSYLGFNVLPGEDKEIVSTVQKGDHWLHTQVKMSAGGHSPVPQFGTYQKEYVDVICLWERPSADTITGWLRDLRLDNHNVIVFYLGRLKIRARGQLRHASRERSLAIAVLDESLLAFLLDKRNRLSQFFRCTLPFATLNPYTPFQAGDVPPEMFFGRREMAKSLQRPEGSCLLYGGRQLGKSALLRHVQREFHSPGMEQYAYVEDIKLLGDPKTNLDTELLWVKIWDSFVRFELLETTNMRPSNIEELINTIRARMDNARNARILLLFDEADNFLDADRRSNYKVVDQLRILTQEMGHRFKVVFAGLHSVQRFQSDGNQPLAHFGAPICVGPLEPDAAQQLIKKPFESLGFCFKDPSVILNILSYTNYHPGLIQLFCQQLLKRMNSSRLGKDEPPYVIDRLEVEAVYRVPELRERFKERFDWTLALDKRYQAIAWSMIHDQFESGANFANTYSTAQVLGLVRYWWRSAFESVPIDEFRGLMDEMCGLGVLLKNSDGYYRLRSPNVVRMMGKKDDIELRLLELDSLKLQNDYLSADGLHAPVDCVGKQYSPFTQAQERLINQNPFGVQLIFGSPALGVSMVEDAVKRMLPDTLLKERLGVFKSVPKTIISASKFSRWLEDYLKKHDQYERVIIYKELDGIEDSPTKLVEAACDLLQAYRRKRQSTRIIFTLQPLAVWKWLQIPKYRREGLENRVSAIVSLRRWSKFAVQERLNQQNKLHSEDVCKKILDATNGWTILLEHLFNQGRKQDDLRPLATQLFANAEDKLKFCQMHACEDQRIERLIKFFNEEHFVPADLLTEEDFSEFLGQPALTAVEVDNAMQYLRIMNIVEDNLDGTICLDPILGRLWVP
ncbi:MAG: hypothetical protein H6Q66_2070 [Firmicutes bacterium]|nr:hypothetical protein [Bacillota bacterium]